ncbi:hypothetical protein EX895_003380 [Sporisorium graminicola]|uniref:Uncharacterized protein n=1 Tax=Sporisorium graminicola TaxID=280036 RepID=A0A4V6ETT2_9BASI|nr:hypothetical protein EX895_003380 [Sporisorium graminicola]TKY87799.1 hypothetical protein EX895_003380 [Sporisorium graminicola]
MQAAPRLQDAQIWLPPRATSRASSYHTVLDHFTNTTTTTTTTINNNNGATKSVESLTSSVEPPGLDDADADAASSPPTSPEIEYETIHHTRHGKALVVEHPTLVNFVPTTEIQTAVSVTADRVVIDTIFPPTAVLRASDRVNRPYAYSEERKDGVEAAGFNVQELLKRHEEELRQTLREKLTDNYDPTGSITEEIFTTLTQVTRFPDPVGTDLKPFSKEQCPCVCCEAGCFYPFEPQPVPSTSSMTATYVQPAASRAVSKSCLDMTEASVPNGGAYGSMRSGKQDKERNKHRFGFLTFGRFSRSRSNLDLAREPADGASSATKSTALPTPAPALPSEVTNQVVPPARSKSFSDLVRRRRSKHNASSSSTAPAAATSATNINGAVQPDVPTRRLARHSLDTTRTPTPLSAPNPPPRRSSKVYAIVSRKPSPNFSTGSATMPRNSMSAYDIGQIVEEDEPRAGDAGVERRQSALMSSYGTPAQGTGQFRVTRRPVPVEQEPQIGLAL